ncbi:MAG: pyridoxamine 5'-phosphate oxidase family protein [Pseudomonadales bacterium]
MTSSKQADAPDFPVSDHNRLRRAAERGHYDRDTVYAVLDAGLLCHIGYEIDGQPYVTPTAYWRDGDRVYWHGSTGSRMLMHQRAGVPVCLTVSHMDGLVMARSAFHHSVNYRSVMAFGTTEPVLDDDEKARQLERLIERLAPGRWAELRPMTAKEFKATLVMSLKLDDVVAKVRSGPPVDDEADYALPVWAGVLPVRTVVAAPEDDPRLNPGIRAPANLSALTLG